MLLLESLTKTPRPLHREHEALFAALAFLIAEIFYHKETY